MKLDPGETLPYRPCNVNDKESCNQSYCSLKAKQLFNILTYRYGECFPSEQINYVTHREPGSIMLTLHGMFLPHL